ncbi:DUF4270 domain-containing protein [Salegentibacter sediminis]|uniref:DUF4270 domain-containing protein n=1 Tax=Salegentibacter sediminis TaxID=1930251 RepID=UPI0009C09708|nr:DUF4270 domain-containing protein [Salegentibacter sediminis]
MNFKRLTGKIAALLAVSFVLVACDDEFSTVGGEIIENPADVELRELEVKTYSKKINSVQTNNLTDYLLGVYNDPVYGETQASIFSQLSLTTTNPDFGDNTKLDSVVLTIPFYSTEGDSDEAGNIEYSLDSIFGEGSFKLSVQESRYFLADFDPDADFQSRQKYYSDQQDLVEQNLVGDVLYENDNFRPSPEAIVNYGYDDVGEADTTTTGPGLRIKLPVNYFQQKIINKEGSSELSNNNNFRDYFRGLFLKAEANNDPGSLMLFNLGEGDVSLYYTFEEEETNEDGDAETIRKGASYQLKFGSNAVNTFEGEFPADVLETITSADTVNGEENLFLKGGEGSMAVIELFEDDTVLEELKENNWLINEVNLQFYVDQDLMAGAQEPDRLYIYDLENNRVLADYSFAEQFIGDLNPEDLSESMKTFSTPLERDEDGNGIKYSLNLTQHVSEILNNDGENVKLGLVITQNINQTANSAVRGGGEVTRVPAMSVLAPLGTVLYGNASENEEKQPKLRIYYTRTTE